MPPADHKTLAVLYLPAIFVKSAVSRLLGNPLEMLMELKRTALILSVLLLSLLIKDVFIPPEYLEDLLSRWLRR